MRFPLKPIIDWIIILSPCHQLAPGLMQSMQADEWTFWVALSYGELHSIYPLHCIFIEYSELHCIPLSSLALHCIAIALHWVAVNRIGCIITPAIAPLQMNEHYIRLHLSCFSLYCIELRWTHCNWMYYNPCKGPLQMNEHYIRLQLSSGQLHQLDNIVLSWGSAKGR